MFMQTSLLHGQDAQLRVPACTGCVSRSAYFNGPHMNWEQIAKGQRRVKTSTSFNKEPL